MSRSARSARHAATAYVGLLACLAAAACSGGRDRSADTVGATGAPGTAAAPATTPADTMMDTSRAAGAATLNDAQIAHVAVTANSIDSAAGVMAREKGRARAVKDFAQTMITDHTGVNERAVALAKRLNVTPENNDVSRQLRAGADSAAERLRGMSGAGFDSAYINHEVAYHQAVLDALDKTLIPGAQNAELKKLLQDVRPAIAAHLERARSIQGTPGGS
jgi:putative membrane protein